MAFSSIFSSSAIPAFKKFAYEILSASRVGTKQIYGGNGAAVCRSTSQEADGIAGAEVTHQLAQDVEHLISGFTDTQQYRTQYTRRHLSGASLLSITSDEMVFDTMKYLIAGLYGLQHH